MTDIDHMTESQIKDEMRTLRELADLGKMTPAQSWRMDQLRVAARQIANTRSRGFSK